jgi:1-deoxy-D-xylulose-5-phosphate reductoisomerase
MSDIEPRTVTILGATGSVGGSTLDILRQQRAVNGKDSIQVEALTAQSNWKSLAKLAREFDAKFVALADPAHGTSLRQALAGTGIEVGIGAGALQVAAERDAEWVMAAITGAAGLHSVLTAAKRGCSLALANKESLVCAGTLLTDICTRNQTTLLPVDSEHNAIFQIFESDKKDKIQRIILTASGGPFRSWDAKKIANATPEQAIAHPVWSMGAKISVDSASLMNKGLELIEARHLFDASPDQLEVLVHPQSVVHGLVEYKDGSTLAHMGPADMRVPIASVWAWPDRISTNVEQLSLANIGKLEFFEPDLEKFPSLAIAMQAMRDGGNSCNAMSAANEVAVASFLQGEVKFSDIPEIVDFVLDRGGDWHGEPKCIEQVFEVDRLSRLAAEQFVRSL